MCKVLDVGKSSYYDWKKKGSPRQSNINCEDLVAIKSVYEKSKKTYGSPRIAEDLRAEGLKISKSTVARIMNQNGIRSKAVKRFKVTTDSNHSYKVAENTLARAFNPKGLNRVWVSDITYIRVNEKWLYLTMVMDLADRMIIGWQLSKTMDAWHTSIAAFKQALSKRNLTDQLIFHSDRGVQYACESFVNELSSRQVIQSMSRKGNCWDNAVAESFFKTLKSECIRRHKLQTKEQAFKVIFDYIEGWYNTRRRHSAIGMISPLQKHILLQNVQNQT